VTLGVASVSRRASGLARRRRQRERDRQRWAPPSSAMRAASGSSVSDRPLTARSRSQGAQIGKTLGYMRQKNNMALNSMIY
jgi:hypothetical protein